MNPPKNDQKWPKSPDQPEAPAAVNPDSTLLLHCPDCNHPLRISRKHVGVPGNCVSCGIAIIARETSPGKVEICRTSDTPESAPPPSEPPVSETTSPAPTGFLSINPTLKNESRETSSSEASPPAPDQTYAEPFPVANVSPAPSALSKEEPLREFGAIQPENSLAEDSEPGSDWVPPTSEAAAVSNETESEKPTGTSPWNFEEAIHSTESSAESGLKQGAGTNPAADSDPEPTVSPSEGLPPSSFFAGVPPREAKPEEADGRPPASGKVDEVEEKFFEPGQGVAEASFLDPPTESQEAPRELNPENSVPAAPPASFLQLSPGKAKQPQAASPPAGDSKVTSPIQTDVGAESPAVPSSPQQVGQPTPPTLPAEIPKPEFPTSSEGEMPVAASSSAAASPVDDTQEPTSIAPAEPVPELPAPVESAPALPTPAPAALSPFADRPEEIKSTAPAEPVPELPKPVESTPAPATPAPAAFSPFADPPEETKSTAPAEPVPELPKPVESTPAPTTPAPAALSPFADPPEEIKSTAPAEPVPELPAPVESAPALPTPAPAAFSPFADPPEEIKSTAPAEPIPELPKPVESAPAPTTPAPAAFSPFADPPKEIASAAPAEPVPELPKPVESTPAPTTPAPAALSPFADPPEEIKSTAPAEPVPELPKPVESTPAPMTPAPAALSPFADPPEEITSAVPAEPVPELPGPVVPKPASTTPAPAALSPFADPPEEITSAVPNANPPGGANTLQPAPPVVAMSPFDEPPESADSAASPSHSAEGVASPTAPSPIVEESPQSITPVSPFETPAGETEVIGAANNPFEVEDNADQAAEISLFGPPADDEVPAAPEPEPLVSDSPALENSMGDPSDPAILDGPILLKQEKVQKASLSPTATFAITIGALAVLGIGAMLVTPMDHKEQIKMQVAEWLEPGTVLIEKLPFGLGDKLLHPDISGKPQGLNSRAPAATSPSVLISETP